MTSAPDRDETFMPYGADPDPDVARASAAVRRITSWLIVGEDGRDGAAALADALEDLAGSLGDARADSRFGGPLSTPDDPYAGTAHPFTGLANPVSPPVRLQLVDGVAEGRGRFDAVYEGPPGAVHGGYVAGVFDVVLGLAARSVTDAAVTQSLTIRYHRPTPLHEDLVFRARVVSDEGRHIHLKGELLAFDDFLTAEAEGVFVATRRPGFA